MATQDKPKSELGGMKAPPSGAFKIVEVPEAHKNMIDEYCIAGTYVGASEDESPWVPFGDNAAIRHLAFDVRNNVYANILWIKSPGVIGTHKHRGMVWAIGMEGTFRYLEYDWVCGPGEFITEFPGHAHTLVTDEPDGMKAFFWMQGANEFYDENGEFVETLDVWWFMNHYESYCKEHGIPINRQLYLWSEAPKTLDQFDLTGRSGLVTGAASGIGLAYAEVLAEAGARVTLTDIDTEGVARETQRLVDAGYEARSDVCDVSDLTQVAAAFDNHVKAYGGCDVAFANAGLDVGNGFWTPEGDRNPDGQIDVYDPDRWYKSIGINLNGVFHTVREAARVMKANEGNGYRRGGSIVITSSNAAEVNEAIVGVPYMAAKAGVKHFMRHSAYELAAYGIRVNAIAPGPFVTNIGDGWVKKNPAAKKAWDQLVPVGRMAETYQIKPLALLLASDAGSYMTGSHVMIDGGMQLGPVKPLND